MTPTARRVSWFLLITVALLTSLGLTLGLTAQNPGLLLGHLSNTWTPHQSEETVSMLLTGDVMLGRQIEVLIGRQDGDFPFTYMPEIITTVENALNVQNLDLVVGNLEGPVTDYTYKSAKGVTFQFEPWTVDLLKKAGFTTVSQANNHTFDQTREGYTISHQYLEAGGIDAFGHPNVVDGEWSFLKYDFDTLSVGFLGLNDVNFKLNHVETMNRIAQLDKEVDVLIIGVHWGVEYIPDAPVWIDELAHKMVDSGADFIWGHHPHVIQNSEIYQGVPIYYSLGNFVFDQYWSKATQEGLVVGLRIDKKGEEIKLLTSEHIVDLVDQGAPKIRVSDQ